MKELVAIRYVSFPYHKKYDDDDEDEEEGFHNKLILQHLSHVNFFYPSILGTVLPYVAFGTKLK
jgi:hypothetical protein